MFGGGEALACIMKILIVDDEENIQKTTALALKTMGHQTAAAFSGSQALRKLGEERIDAVFLDLRLGEEDGLQVFDRMREEGHDMPVIMFTAYSSIETAVEATRKGVFDYVPKPFVPEQIRQALKKLETTLSLKSRVELLESQVDEKSTVITFESKEPLVQQTYDIADKAARSDATMLILGPSGTGKSVLAQRIHKNSSRADKPFVTVHCPSLSKELLESELFGHIKGAFTGAVKETWGKVAAADQGTLFLDEIGDLSMEIQAKLLRLLQERAYERVGEVKTRKADTRIVAATNKDLQREVEAGRFREDLYYRLNVISLVMPSLSERQDDIVPISERYIEYYSKKLGKAPMKLSEAAHREFLRYPWPGNLRELSNVLERSVILANGDTIEPNVLPEDFHRNNDGRNSSGIKPGSMVTLEELESEHMLKIIEKAESLDKAAAILGIDSTTLYRKRKKMGLI